MSSPPREIGTLVVVVLRGRNLPNKRQFGKQDPYCSLSFNQETKRISTATRGGQHPEWDDEVRFSIFEDVGDEIARTETPPRNKRPRNIQGGKLIHVLCYAERSLGPGLIGETKIDLTEVLTKGEVDEWFTLQNDKGRYAGEVYLEMTFWSNERPPIKPIKEAPRPSAFYPQPAVNPRYLSPPNSGASVSGFFGPRGPEIPIERPPVSRPPTGARHEPQVIYVAPVEDPYRPIRAGLSLNPVISSMLSSTEIIAMLGERGCANLSSFLDPLQCSQYPVSSGGFGDIFTGRLYNGTKVAIKTMRPCDADGLLPGKYQKRSAKELYTWSKCNHPNVATLLGLAEFRGRLAMLSDWAENGNVSSYIRNNPSVNRCALSTGVCEGLVYLHENDIIHGDLKGANILVSGDGTPMLTDFGNAILSGSSVAFTTTATSSFSLRWTAPEIIEESCSHNRESDIYALGMTILEIITGNVPFHDVKDLLIARTIVDKKKTPPRPEDQIPIRSVCGNILWTLLMSCWAREPGLRPTAAQARDIMKPLTPEALIHVEAGPDSEVES